MSSSLGEVTFTDGLKLNFSYHGTSDICRTRLSKNEEFDWSQNQEALCACGQDEAVTIDSGYGGMEAWQGRACRHCKAMTAGMLPYSEAYYW